MKNRIPIWISIVSGLIAVLGIFVGVSLYISPGTFIPKVDFTLSEVKYLTDMWAARQIAIAIIIAYSLFKQSSEMLKVSLIAYCLMNFQDIVIGFLKADYGLAIGAFIFTAISAVMIFVLARK